MSKSFFFRVGSVLVILAGLAVLFYLPYSTVRERTIAAYNSEQTLLARQAAQGMENTFRMYEKALRYFAAHPSIINMDRQGQRMLFDFYAIHRPTLISVARLDGDGTIRHRISGTQRLDENALNRAFKSLDPAGEKIQDIIGRDSTLVALLRPVTRDGENVGSLVFLVDYRELSARFIGPLRKSAGKKVWVLSSEGIVLECSNPAHTGAHISESTRSVDRDSSLLTVMRKMIRGGSGEANFEILDREKGRDLRSHVVFMPVLLPGGSFWSIACASPEQSVLANMTTFRNYWLLVTSFVLLALLLLGFLFIRARIRAEEKAQRSALEKQIIELMDFTPVGIIVYDMEGNLRYANRAARRMWAGTNEKIPLDQLNVFDYIHPDDMEKVRNRFREVIRGGSSSPEVIKVVFPPPGNVPLKSVPHPSRSAGSSAG
ncbi:MAG: hypothetical protein Kow0089_06470 [Desulfobulbaceae bacterium]